MTKNNNEKSLTAPITEALTKIADSVSHPVEAISGAANVTAGFLPKIEWPRDYSLADYACEKIIERINQFEESLPDDMQAGGRLVAFGDNTFTIDDVTYQNPNILIFYGTTSNGEPVQLIQHTSQLNLFLFAVKRTNPEEPRRKIGFLGYEEKVNEGKLPETT